MKLSVILPCFNGAKTIAVQLEALVQQCWSEPWELVVVNNGSTDNSMQIVESYRDRLPNLRIVNAHVPPAPRLGVSHSYNVGVQAAKGDAVAFCEADDEVAPDWLATVGTALDRYDFVSGALGYELFLSSTACWLPASFRPPALSFTIVFAISGVISTDKAGTGAKTIRSCASDMALVWANLN